MGSQKGEKVKPNQYLQPTVKLLRSLSSAESRRYGQGGYVKESSLENLKALTESFFSNHWNRDKLGDPPTWSERYAFEGSLPNHNMQGVYAFLKENIVTYVGVGTSLGGGRYSGHGLGKRFQAYTKVIKGVHTPTDPRLVESGSMVTIGFPQEYAYLANALELYLIGRMETQYNVHRPGRAVKP